MLVGQATEPRVELDRSRIAFRPLLLRSKAKETFFICNSEHIPFAFQWDAASVASEGAQPALIITPMSGTIPPEGKVAIEVEFTPRAEKQYNFNAVCIVKKKPTKLMLNVKGEGFSVRDTLELATSDGPATMAADLTNYVDFGNVHINDIRTKQFAVINDGRFPLDFSWTLTPQSFVLLNPMRGSVGPHDRLTCEVTFRPTSETQLNNCKAVCRVTNGKQYTVQFTGSGSKPMLNFSFYNFDFGPQFLTTQGFAPVTQTLHITNGDQHEVMLDMLYENTPHIDVSPAPAVLAPGETRAVTITFSPREVMQYRETIAYEVNGLYTINVSVTGEGSAMRLELAKPEQQQLNLGALRVGQEAIRTVKVVNRSKLALSFRVSEKSLAELQAVSVYISPSYDVMLRPRESAILELRFAPNTRIGTFDRKLDIDAAGVTRPLLSVSGTCQGLELRLDSETLSFGSVVKNSSVTKKLRLSNMGEIGAKFKWPSVMLEPMFRISPTDGYVPPNGDVLFDVTFQPQEPNPDITIGPIPCQIEGTAPLLLTLTGICVPAPTDAKQLTFKCKVRQTTKETITIPNKFDVPWKLQPSIDHEYWSGQEMISVTPGQPATYVLTYTPLTMTKAEPHKGVAFFPLPDGSAIMYTLVGTADAPDSAGTISKEFQCKVQSVIPLKVSNWLRRPQRFKVSVVCSFVISLYNRLILLLINLIHQQH